MHLKLNEPQGQFLSVKKKFNAFVGGYRSGKTFVGCVRMWMLALQYPNIKLGYFAPTYPMISDIFYTTISDVGELLSAEWNLDLKVDINISRKEVKLICNGIEYALVKCRAMEHAHRIVGFDINHAQIDEIDTMKMNKADAAWKKIIARMSSVSPDYPMNTVDFTTTPEGFNFVYNLFVMQIENDPKIANLYSLTKASTRQNAKNLPDDYIQSLYDTYPSQLVDAYVDGEFVNLTSGSVYPCFDRVKHNSSETENGSEPLIVGMDFNVNNMAACIFVQRGKDYHQVDEITKGRDTSSVCETLKQKYPNRKITVYPDASGKNSSSKGASVSDISIIKQFGFWVVADDANPRVKNRVNSVNKAFESGQLFINTLRCPETTRCIEQQAYDDNGEPDKKSGLDHQNDAFGYPIVKLLPIVKPLTKGFAVGR